MSEQAPFKLPRYSLNPPVFLGSSLFILLLVTYTACFPEKTGIFFFKLQASIMVNASWFYVSAEYAGQYETFTLSLPATKQYVLLSYVSQV